MCVCVSRQSSVDFERTQECVVGVCMCLHILSQVVK
jgi:hypothetical protein